MTELVNGAVVMQLRRGAGNRSARVLIMQFSAVVKGAKILAGVARENFRRNSLTNRMYERGIKQ